MKKHIVLWLMVLALCLSGCGSSTQPTLTPDVQARFVSVVSVTGEVVPEMWSTLSSKTGGTLVGVLVEPGASVSAGDVMVRLDTIHLETALDIARQDVAAQQALLDQLLKAASDQVIARAARENAYQVAQAEIALKAKRQQLAEARAQDPGHQVSAAQTRVRQFELRLTQARTQDLAPEVEISKVELERARIALEDTQDEYNKALDRPWEDQSIRDGWAKQLEQVRLNHRLAQAQLDSTIKAQQAHAISLDVLQAQLEEAHALLAQALDAQEAFSITQQVMETSVEAARLQIDHLRAWENPYLDEPSDEEISQATALLQQAKLRVIQVEQQIDDAEVCAPFDGTVGAVQVRMGELVTPGQPLVTVGDLTRLRVETTDLDEIDVVRISLDQQVSITFDALPDRVVTGRVTRISPMAEPGSGGVHYTVVVEMGEVDSVLRWGMTAFVDIEVAEE